VTKAELIDRIATGTGLTRIETEAVVHGFITTVMEALAEGDSVELRGFGSFRVQYRAARTAHNPRTKERVEIEGHHLPVFRPSQDFREAVDEAMKAVARTR
jgi:DNA-binding protein HU-beta